MPVQSRVMPVRTRVRPRESRRAGGGEEEGERGRVGAAEPEAAAFGLGEATSQPEADAVAGGCCRERVRFAEVRAFVGDVDGERVTGVAGQDGDRAAAV